jgi:hypothetical protein
MVFEVEDMDDAFPYGLAFECLQYWHGLDERSRPAVLEFDGLLETTRFDFGH